MLREHSLHVKSFLSSNLPVRRKNSPNYFGSTDLANIIQGNLIHMRHNSHEQHEFILPRLSTETHAECVINIHVILGCVMENLTLTPKNLREFSRR